MFCSIGGINMQSLDKKSSINDVIKNIINIIGRNKTQEQKIESINGLSDYLRNLDRKYLEFSPLDNIKKHMDYLDHKREEDRLGIKEKCLYNPEIEEITTDIYLQIRMDLYPYLLKTGNAN